jgi:hypothetical protein
MPQGDCWNLRGPPTPKRERALGVQIFILTPKQLVHRRIDGMKFKEGWVAMGSSQQLRAQAARARYQHAAMPDDRDAWLAIAERWEHLAKIEEADSQDLAEMPIHQQQRPQQPQQQQQQQPQKRDDDLD